MASIVYNSFLSDLATGAIDLDSDTFWVMLCDSSYVPDKDAHSKRSNISGEVSGTGYTAGGKVCTVSVALDLANDRTNVTLGGTAWTGATLTARYAPIYKRRGGLASADELVGCIDFGSDKGVVNGTLTLTDSVIRFQN